MVSGWVLGEKKSFLQEWLRHPLLRVRPDGFSSLFQPTQFHDSMQARAHNQAGLLQRGQVLARSKQGLCCGCRFGAALAGSRWGKLQSWLGWQNNSFAFSSLGRQSRGGAGQTANSASSTAPSQTRGRSSCELESWCRALAGSFALLFNSTTQGALFQAVTFILVTSFFFFWCCEKRLLVTLLWMVSVSS